MLKAFEKQVTTLLYVYAKIETFTINEKFNLINFTFQGKTIQFSFFDKHSLDSKLNAQRHLQVFFDLWNSTKIQKIWVYNYTNLLLFSYQESDAIKEIQSLKMSKQIALVVYYFVKIIKKQFIPNKVKVSLRNLEAIKFIRLNLYYSISN